jgi:hypothetical protein
VRLLERQHSEFHLRAPDEPQARAALEAAQPDWVKQRANALRELFPSRDQDA